MKEQIVIDVILDTMVMELHVTICGTHKTTPASGSAATATDCKLLYFG